MQFIRQPQLTAFFTLLLLSTVPALSQAIADGKLSAAQQTRSPKDRAWEVLKMGIDDHGTEKRATAIRVLGLVPQNTEAARLAEQALGDEKPEVRTAAAIALGQMKDKDAIPKLQSALDDKDTAVVLSAANALREMEDPAAYKIYYAVLTGDRKSSKGLIADQEKMLKDPKKMAMFGFEQGIGQIPFAGMGFQAIKALTKDDASPVRAAAAKALANDPDPRSGEALVLASADNSWIVRTAALDAIARRDDPALIPKIESSLNDDKNEVRYTGAAAIVRLASITPPKPADESPKNAPKTKKKVVPKKPSADPASGKRAS